MSKIVVIDPGHGGSDPGAVNGARMEKNDNLRLAFAVRDQLVGQGVSVLMTRVDDSCPTLNQRANLANDADADLFLSLHRNSYTGTGANGVEIWVYTHAGAVDVGAATEVLERLVDVGVQSNRGIKKGDYHVLRETKIASMLIELGFLSNLLDNILFDGYFDRYTKAIAQGACAAMGIRWNEPGEITQPDADPPLFRVQVGAFAHRTNAEAFLENVRAMGLEAFLVEPAS